ncbi:MAG: ParB/RepB/Spo0J family partition protein [Planctomycetota bacterium]
MEKRLGRGLSALISPAEEESRNQELPLRIIQPNPFQPRKVLEAGDLEQLRDSIRNHGILQPVVVRRTNDGFQLISGERRWRAARLAGLEVIPAVIREGVDDGQMLELALVENLQRKDLNPIERADGFQRLMGTLGLTQEEVARKVGLRRSTVANHLRLLELPPEVREAVARHMLTMGHARALLGLVHPEEQVALMEEAIRDDLSVREIERRVRELVGKGATSATGTAAARDGAADAPVEVPAWVAEQEQRLRQSLETKVRILNEPGYRGRILIEYYDRSQLDRLLERLAPALRI